MILEQRLIHDGVTEVANYSLNWTEEQINSLHQRPSLFWTSNILSEVVREHPPSKKEAWSIRSIHQESCMNQLILITLIKNSPVRKAQLLRLSFEYNEKEAGQATGLWSAGHW